MNRVVAFALALLQASTLAAAIRGSVFDDEGKPIANAAVRAYRAEGHVVRRTRLAGRTERAALASATTGDDGTFSLDPKQSGFFEVVVTASGYAPSRQLVQADTQIVFGITAAPPRTVTVTAGGKPVPNAVIVARGAQIELGLGTTDDKGTLTIPDPRGWCSSLLVVHPDYAFAEVPAAKRSLAIALTPGVRVTGRIVDANDKPVANAMLRVDGWPLGKSDEDGTFVLPHVAADAKRIEASTPALLGSAPRGAKETILRVEPVRIVSGSVVDDARRPMAGIPVMAWTRAAGSTYSITDDRGGYRIELAPSSYTVMPIVSADFQFDPAAAELVTKMTARADFAATRSDRVRGVVRDARNKPVAGAIVSFVNNDMPLFYAAVAQDSPVVRTAGDGSFSLPAAPDSSKLYALHPRYAIGIGAIEDKSHATITMPDGIAVTGTVVDADDKPVAGAGVIIVEGAKSAMPLPLDLALASGYARPFVTSASDGTFRVHLNDAPHDLGVWKEGYSAARKANFRPGQPLRLVLGNGVTIAGRVVQKGADAIEGMISARSEQGSAGMAQIESDGSFTINSLAPGSYTIVAQTRAGTSDPKIVDAPAQDVVIELEQLAEIRGKVVDKETGEAIAAYDYATQGPSGSVTDGAPFTASVPAGSTAVSISAAGYVSVWREVKAAAGKTTEVTFALERGRTLRGRVVDEQGAPLRGVSVDMESEEPGSFGAMTDEAGEFLLERASRENVTLQFRLDGYRPAQTSVAASATGAINVTMTKGRSVTGRVIDETGAAVEGAQIMASSAVHDASIEGSESAADGTFTIGALGDGRYSFRATKAGYAAAALDDVDIAKTPAIVLRFGPRTPVGEIHGRVTGYSESGFFMAQVIATPADGDDSEQILRGEVDRDGTYKIDGVPAGETQVYAIGLGMSTQRSTAVTKTSVVAGGDVQVDLAFRNDVVVRGTVTDNGVPAPARHVAFNAGATAAWQTTTNASGEYELTGVEPGHYDVTVYGSRNQSFRTEYDVTGSATFDIALHFATLEGRVTDTDGAPIDGATVETKDTEGRTDVMGLFSLDVPAGDYEVRVTKRGFASATQHTSTGSAPLSFRLVRSEGVRVRLIDARDGATLGGYVATRDAAGMQLNRVHNQETDGALTLSVTPGTYRISASADGYATQTVQTSVPHEGELRIALTPGGTLIVRTDHDATGIVKLVMPDGEEYVRCECNGITDIRLSGRMTTIEHVAAGSYTMQVLGAEGKVVSSYPVTIMEGGTAVVEVHL